MTTHRTYPKIPGFRLGIYVFKDAEIVDYAAPYGVLSVARRFDPELDAFLIADAMRAVQTQAGFTVLPNSTGRTWTRFSSPAASERGRKCKTGCCMSSSGRCRRRRCSRGLHGHGSTAPWGCATANPQPTARSGSARSVKVWQGADRPTRQDRAEGAHLPCPRGRCRAHHHRRWYRLGHGMGFHLLRRAGFDEALIGDVARVREYKAAYDLYRDDVEYCA